MIETKLAEVGRNGSFFDPMDAVVGPQTSYKTTCCCGLRWGIVKETAADGEDGDECMVAQRK